MENLLKSKILCTFAPAFGEKVGASCKNVRGLAQLVAHTSGGREVAGSSPVAPTLREKLIIIRLEASFFCFCFCCFCPQNA